MMKDPIELKNRIEGIRMEMNVAHADLNELSMLLPERDRRRHHIQTAIWDMLDAEEMLYHIEMMLDDLAEGRRFP